TFGLDPTIGIIMLTGIFYGAMYGGSTTSILVRIPGEAASVVTCIDGYEMARKGRAGPALMISAPGSFLRRTLSTLPPLFLPPPAARYGAGRHRPRGRGGVDPARALRDLRDLGRLTGEDCDHDRARPHRRNRRPRQAHRRAAFHLRQPGIERRHLVCGTRHRL